LNGIPSPLEENRTVKDYIDLLDTGTGLILVGGQAVNLWAEKYQSLDARILAFHVHQQGAINGAMGAGLLRQGREIRDCHSGVASC
jgi:activator of 2-hydroxyglutaryl-CoA dehydratase